MTKTNWVVHLVGGEVADQRERGATISTPTAWGAAPAVSSETAMPAAIERGQQEQRQHRLGPIALR